MGGAVGGGQRHPLEVFSECGNGSDAQGFGVVVGPCRRVVPGSSWSAEALLSHTVSCVFTTASDGDLFILFLGN